MTKSYLLSGFLIISAIFASATVCKAASEPAGEPLFRISMADNMWGETPMGPGTKLESKELAGGTQWTTWGFTHTQGDNGLYCGIKDVSFTSTLTSMNKVKDQIGIVSAYIYYDPSYLDNLKGVTLEMSADPSFENCTEVTCPIQEATTTFWNFEISEPAENQYYRLSISFDACANNWINLMQLAFYAPDDNSGEGDENGGDGDGETVSVNNLSTEAATCTAQWYTLQGVKTDNPQGGVYIRVADGKAVKVLR